MNEIRNVPPVRLFQDSNSSFELRFDDGSGLAGFTFGKGFADAKDDGESGIEGGTGLLSNEFGALVEYCAALGVTYKERCKQMNKTSAEKMRRWTYQG